MTEALKYEVNHFGIQVALVEPGFFQTEFSGNVVRFGMEPPYDELGDAWHAASMRLRGGAEVGPGPEAVVQMIADVVESDAPKLRNPVGDDAVMVCGARASMSDEEFEAAMRATLDLTW